jgi:hypothetical protein
VSPTLLFRKEKVRWAAKRKRAQTRFILNETGRNASLGKLFPEGRGMLPRVAGETLVSPKTLAGVAEPGKRGGLKKPFSFPRK